MTKCKDSFISIGLRKEIAGILQRLTKSLKLTRSSSRFHMRSQHQESAAAQEFQEHGHAITSSFGTELLSTRRPNGSRASRRAERFPRDVQAQFRQLAGILQVTMSRVGRGGLFPSLWGCEATCRQTEVRSPGAFLLKRVQPSNNAL